MPSRADISLFLWLHYMWSSEAYRKSVRFLLQFGILMSSPALILKNLNSQGNQSKEEEKAHCGQCERVG